MVTVLVTGVGGVGGCATVQSLLDRTDHEVIGVDMDSRARGFFLLDHSTTVPAAQSPDWIEAITDIVSRHDVDVIVPLVDEELARLPALEKSIPNDVRIVAPRNEVIDITLDKWNFAEWLSESGLPAPETSLLSETDHTSIDFPVVAKPRFGHGSTGIERLDSRSDLEHYRQRTEYDPDEILLQQHLEGTEFTTSVVSTKENRLIGIVPKEVIEKEGNTTWGVTRKAPDVERSCRRLYDELRPAGPINVQQIVDDETGDVLPIEINPRFSSTACLTVAAGVNELDLLIRDAVGQPLDEPESFRSDVHMIRHTDHYFLPEDQLDV